MQAEKAEDGIRTRATCATVEQYQQEYASYSVEKLKAELLRLMNFSVENLIRMASIVSELDGRGVLMGGMNISIMPMLRAIARGRLLPDIVVKFSGEYDKIKRAGRLTIREQQEIASGSKELAEPAKRTRVAYTKHLEAAPPPKALTVRKQQITDANLPPLKPNPRDTALSYWQSMQALPDSRLVLNHFFRLLVEQEIVDGELARLMRQFSVRN